MAMQTETIDITSPSGVTISHTLTRPQPDSTRLMIMLPGRAYTCDFPVLYYVRNVGHELGFDVLSLRYNPEYMANGVDVNDDPQAIIGDILEALQEVHVGRYKQVCIVAKSFGTLLWTSLMSAILQKEVGLILLTPLPPGLQMFESMTALAIIGTQDPVYSPELERSAAKVGIKMQVLEMLDHGLEVPGEWKSSVAALEIVARTCEGFLQTTFAS